MKIKRFIERDSRSALARVREEMGADAMILSNRRMGDRTEVVAALDLDEDELALAAQPEVNAAPPANELAMQQLQNELAHLRGVLETQLEGRSWRDSAGRPSVQVTINQRFARMGLSRALGGAIVDALPPRGRLQDQWERALVDLTGRIPVSGELFGGDRIAVACLGATGVGKTTTIAKLAAREMLRSGRENVALVSMDAYRIGGQEQLATFAECLGLPFTVAADAAALDAALRRFRRQRVFIDTAGMGQRDPRLVQQLDVLRARSRRIGTCLVLSAAAQTAQTRELVLSFGRQAVSGAIITKIDEATSLGGVLDALIRARLSVVRTCDGQRVPEDIAPARARQLVASAVELLESQSGAPSQVRQFAGGRAAAG